jgi:spermidine synthase
MLAQVREPLLAVLRISPDFQPAADPLLRMAQALSINEPIAGQALHDEVLKLRSGR